MKKTYRYNKDMDCLIGPDGQRSWDFDRCGIVGNQFIPAAPMLISDIREYRTVAGDVAHEGKRVHIGSRSRHREFLRDNRYVEVGNDFMTPQLANNGVRKETKAQFKAKQAKRVEAIKASIDWVRKGVVSEHVDNRPETIKDHFHGT